MNIRPSDLPDYAAPPVVEVVLGVQFAPLPAFEIAHVGTLWDLFRLECPEVRYAAPLTQTFETFGGSPDAAVRVQLLLTDRLVLPRLQFMDESGARLVQFQHDRFIHNWRKIGEGDSYPRYEFIKKKFFEQLDYLDTYLSDAEIGKIEPNQCEVTYVNHIFFGDDENFSTVLDRLFVHWSDPNLPEAIGSVENSNFTIRVVIRSEDGDPQGRLIVVAEPGRNQEGDSLVVLRLTARGHPTGPDFDGVSEFLDIGRDKIVRGFTELTTDEMHRHWERKQ